MDENWIEQVRLTLNQKSSEELRQIWEENDRTAWTDDAFEAIQRILEERGESIEPQALPAPLEVAQAAKSQERPGCVTAYALLTAIGIVLYALFSILVAIAVGVDEAGMIEIGTMLVLTGLIIAVAVGLWRLQNWARIAVIVLQSFSLILSIILMLNGAFGIPSLIGLAIGGYTIYWFATNRGYFIKPQAG